MEPPSAATAAAAATVAATTVAAAIAPRDSAQPPDVPGWRVCLRGLRGALPPDVRREAAALVALAGPVVSARPRGPAPPTPDGGPARAQRSACCWRSRSLPRGLASLSRSPSFSLGSSWRS